MVQLRIKLNRFAVYILKELSREGCLAGKALDRDLSKPICS